MWSLYAATPPDLEHLGPRSCQGQMPDLAGCWKREFLYFKFFKCEHGQDPRQDGAKITLTLNYAQKKIYISLTFSWQIFLSISVLSDLSTTTVEPSCTASVYDSGSCGTVTDEWPWCGWRTWSCFEQSSRNTVYLQLSRGPLYYIQLHATQVTWSTKRICLIYSRKYPNSKKQNKLFSNRNNSVYVSVPRLVTSY